MKKSFNTFKVEDYNIYVQYVAPQSYVSQAERKIRTIKERSRSTFHRLILTTFSKLVLIYLVTDCACKLNFFAAKLGLSKYYSTRKILYKHTLEFKTQGTHHIGDYVLAHNDSIIKNNLSPRTLDCLYLRPAPSSKTTHDFYHISTNKVIFRSRCTPLPTTTNMIQLIIAQTKKDNNPEGLKFNNNINSTV